MDQVKVIITGENVQEVGYRVFLLTNALNLGISKFYAYNTRINGKQAVIMHIGDEKEVISNFYSYIKENIPEDAEVSDFKMEEFKGNIMDIDKYLHLIQIEQLNKGIPAILDIRENTRKMLEKQDKMLEKQDSTIGLLGAIKEDTSSMKSTLSRMEIDIKDTKFSLSSFIEEKFRKQEIEIAEIKTSIARLQEAVRA